MQSTQAERAGVMDGSVTRDRPKLIVGILLLLIAAYPICFMWQGLDVTDTGYALANCQQFFHAYPKDMDDPYLTNRWLSHLLGGAWYEVTGGCGLLGFRILYVLLLYATLATIYAAIRGAGKRIVLLSLLAATALCVSKSLYVPTYNEFTALFFIFSAVSVYYGLTSHRMSLVFLGGLSGGVALFARFPPNIMVVGLAAGIWYYHALAAGAWKRFWGLRFRRALRESAAFALGYALGASGVLLLIVMMGHVGAFVKMWHVLFTMVKDPADVYNGAGLLKQLLRDYFFATVALLGSLVCGVGLAFVGARWRSRLARIVLVAVPAILLAVFLLKSPYWDVWFFPGALYAALLMGVCGLLPVARDYRLLCLLSAVVLFIVPLGSGNGIYNAFYGAHLAVPVAVLALAGGLRTEACSRSGSNADGVAGAAPALDGADQKLAVPLPKWLRQLPLNSPVVGYALAAAIFMFSASYRFGYTYRDTPQRWAMRASIDDPMLRGVFTTPTRARVVKELLDQLRLLVQPDDFLIAHQELPLIHFLTKARPYLYCTWPNFFPPGVFRQNLARAQQEHPQLPVCVLNKVNTSHPKWPDETYPPVTWRRFVENQRTVDAFLATNHYQKRWENKAFEIWLPPAYHALGGPPSTHGAAAN